MEHTTTCTTEHTITFTSEEFGTLINALIVAKNQEKKVSEMWTDMHKANIDEDDCKYWKEIHFQTYEAIDALLQRL